MRIHTLFIFTFLTVFSFNFRASDIDIEVKNAKGECFIINITPEQARERALIEAKFDALKKAGIGESVNMVEVLISHENTQDYKSVSNIELGGEVIKFSIIKEDVIKTTELNVLTAIVEINATVRKYTKPRDPSFKIQVMGIKAAYEENENFTFSVKPYRDGYLRIFTFEFNNAGNLFYPNLYEKNELFQAEENVDFPVSKMINYPLRKIDETKNVESNLILFVYLKEDVPFTEKNVNIHTVLNWLAKIDPDRRTEVYNFFNLYQKK